MDRLVEQYVPGILYHQCRNAPSETVIEAGVTPDLIATQAMYLNSGSKALLKTQDMSTDEIVFSTDLDHDINSLGTEELTISVFNKELKKIAYAKHQLTKK